MHPGPVLLAYIDEIGDHGAYISDEHARFNTSPAFGYGGFVLPADRAREFGAIFTREKRTLFAREIAASANPGQWEKKGSSMFRKTTPDRFPQYLRVFDFLVRNLQRLNGDLFFYADEKQRGTPKQVRAEKGERESSAMRETLNRLATHAERKDQPSMIIIDQITEKTRAERLPNMYGHILGRAADRAEMRRIIEPPMHVDSALSSNVQFADWVAAVVGRAIHYQLVVESAYGWTTDRQKLASPFGAFTHESKLHLFPYRGLADVNHSAVFSRKRPVNPAPTGQLVGEGVDPAKLRALLNAKPSK